MFKCLIDVPRVAKQSRAQCLLKCQTNQHQNNQNWQLCHGSGVNPQIHDLRIYFCSCRSFYSFISLLQVFAVFLFHADFCVLSSQIWSKQLHKHIDTCLDFQMMNQTCPNQLKPRNVGRLKTRKSSTFNIKNEMHQVPILISFNFLTLKNKFQIIKQSCLKPIYTSNVLGFPNENHIAQLNVTHK